MAIFEGPDTTPGGWNPEMVWLARRLAIVWTAAVTIVAVVHYPAAFLLVLVALGWLHAPHPTDRVPDTPRAALE
jgi:hypothetical protein